MVGRVSGKPPIPLVELVEHYRQFSSKRDASGARGRYRTQAARKELAEHYVANTAELAAMFERSVRTFATYSNIAESFTGTTRKEQTVTRIDEITTGPKAAAYMARALGGRTFRIDELGEYVYIDREVRPARTTSRPEATMANHFDCGVRSTSAMSADLLLSARPERRPTVGEVKLSTASGDDADAFYALIQALAAAAQLVGENQRERLKRCYPGEDFGSGPIDVLVFDLQLGRRLGNQTYRPELQEIAGQICTYLDNSDVLGLDRVALVSVVPDARALRFTRQTY
jgi:hypothetical protein